MKLPPKVPIPLGLRPLLRDIKTILRNNRNARTHKKSQIKALARMIEKVGFNSAIMVDGEGRILAGHARYAAALLLGMTHIPVIVLGDLTEAQKRAFVLGDNQLATLSGWDRGILAEDFAYLNGELPSLGITFADLGFAVGEVNAISEDRGNILGGDPADALPKPAKVVVTEAGQIWHLGPLGHRVMCGDARSVDELVRLLAGAFAAMCFVDKPYNVPVDGHIQGNGGIQHDEFAMASGEMSPAEFRAFVKVTDEVIRAGMKEGGLSAIYRPPKPKSATMPRWTSQLWPHNLNQTASGNPGAVQNASISGHGVCSASQHLPRSYGGDRYGLWLSSKFVEGACLRPIKSERFWRDRSLRHPHLHCKCRSTGHAWWPCRNRCSFCPHPRECIGSTQDLFE